jgi:hypothetical protein
VRSEIVTHDGDWKTFYYLRTYVHLISAVLVKRQIFWTHDTVSEGKNDRRSPHKKQAEARQRFLTSHKTPQTIKKMFVSPATLLSFLMAAPMAVHAATGASFSYDPTAEYGPANWGKLAIDGNACDGESNSPIAVTTGPCDRWGNYKFQVCNVM